jgi:nucleoside-diphosphate-sugar epimerase
MNIFLTGASGNIGSSVLEALVARGHRVRALALPAEAARMARRHRGRPPVELLVGDVRDPAAMRRAVAGQDAVVHLAAVIPPLSEERPALARAVNLDGTRHLLDACAAQPRPPHFLFASTFDLFGHTAHLPPPRTLDDPVAATDIYTETKLLGEQLVRAAGLPWCILRFADVPLMGFRAPHPIMFTLPLEQRFEVLHTRDAALAVANALEREAAWEATWLIGGGPTCQITYREFLFTLLDAMGIGPLPERCFATSPYCTDWLDTGASQALLTYQRHSFADIAAEIRRLAGLRRPLLRLLGPLPAAAIAALSPYARRREGVRA